MTNEMQSLLAALALPSSTDTEKSHKTSALADAILAYILVNDETGSDDWQEQYYDDAHLKDYYQPDNEEVVAFLSINQTWHQEYDTPAGHRYRTIFMTCAYVIHNPSDHTRRLGTYQWYSTTDSPTPTAADLAFDSDAQSAHDEHWLWDLEHIATYIAEAISKNENV